MKTQAKPTVTASDILKLLESKHAKDVFVAECKDGPTHAASHQRLDAWAMPRSWANERSIGYEIKVSRGDFLSDEKWLGYLKLCNEFSFVTPSGLVQPEELPDKVGLLWVAKTGSRLFTKRKAVYREAAIPESLYRYILMCRSKILEGSDNEEDPLEYWRGWLADKKEMKHLGYRISRRTALMFDELRYKLDQYQVAHQELQRLKVVMKERGLDPHGYGLPERLDQALATGQPVINAKKIRRACDIIKSQAQSALEALPK